MKTDKEEISINLCDTCRKGCKVRREAIVSECSKYKPEPKAETILEQPKEVEKCKCISSNKTYNEQKNYYENICITCGKPIVEEKECEQICHICGCNKGHHDLHCSAGKCPTIKPVPPEPQAEIEETIEYIDTCDYADTDRIVSYLDYLVTQLRKILKLKYGIHRH